MNLLRFAALVTLALKSSSDGVTVDATIISNFSLDFSILPGSENLCSPRKLSVYKNHLYIAEAGIGPLSTNAQDLPCYPNAFEGSDCLGRTSKVSKIPAAGGARRDIITGLTSIRALTGQGENHATGAAVAVVDSHCGGGNNRHRDECLYVVMGLGMNGTQLRLDNIDGKIGPYGAIVEFDDNTLTPWAYPWEDIAANSYGSGSNPYDLHIYKDKFYTVDAGCNCVLVYERNKKTGKESGKGPFVLLNPKFTGLKALTTVTDPFGICRGVTPPMGAPFCGRYRDSSTGAWLYDVEFVPTAVRMRPGHRNKIYVSALAGALWTEPVAEIYEYTLNSQGYPQAETARKVPGGPYWAVADFIFSDDENTMYVLETNPGSPYVPFSGSLSKISLVSRHDNEPIRQNVQIMSSRDKSISGLVSPSGIMIHKNRLYITDTTYNPSGPGGICNARILVAHLPSPSGKKGTTDGVGKKETMDGAGKNEMTSRAGKKETIDGVGKKEKD